MPLKTDDIESQLCFDNFFKRELLHLYILVVVVVLVVSQFSQIAYTYAWRHKIMPDFQTF